MKHLFLVGRGCVNGLLDSRKILIDRTRLESRVQKWVEMGKALV